MSDPCLDEWIALRRVHDSGIAKSAGVYLDHGRPTPEHLTGVFDRLIWIRLVTVAEGDMLWVLRRLSLTDTGQTRYTALCEQRQRTALPTRAAEFTTQPPRPRLAAGRAPLASQLPAASRTHHDREPHHDH